MNSKPNFTNNAWKNFKWLLAAGAGMLLLWLAPANGTAQTYEILHTFGTSGDGEQPYSGLALGSDGMLYGTTWGGGSSGNGTVFKLSTNGSAYTTLKRFTGQDGRCPWAGLVIAGTSLYGTTCYGGNFADGTVFKINVDGTDYTVLEHLGSDAIYPAADLVLSGNRVYGAACYGNIFEINTDGSGYTLLQHFAQGGMPYGGLVLSGTTLYGTVYEGGPSYYDGMVFKINTDGSGYMVVKTMGESMGESAGRMPKGTLLLSGNTLYGTASGGGNFLCGTLFKVNTDGSDFTVLKHFTGGNDEGYPNSGVVLCGDTLYGTTERGVSGGCGTVFSINTNGNNYTLLKTFTGDDGRYPMGSLLLIGTNLYGTTEMGGNLDQGVVFSLSVPAVLPAIVAPAQSQTAELGANVWFSLRTAGSRPLGCQWYFNGTNLIRGNANPLALTNVQFSDAGAYTAVVTNLFGAVTSPPAMLNVIAPVERRPVPGVHLTGEAGSLLNVDYANTLSATLNWLPLDTVTLVSTSQYWFDVSEPLPPQRFYRAWQTGTPSVIPSLSMLGIAPAITLTGNIGASVRLDYINQFGPIDTWVTLATVTLTNTSQLYFDTSSIGHPARLYRVVPVP